MSKLKILEYPDPRLRTRAKKVEKVDDELRRLIDDMFETMYAAPGIGLAATQVNVHKRLLVLDVSEEQDTPRLYINPEILETDGDETCEEGCLSVPGVFESVQRSAWIRVAALDANGSGEGGNADGGVSFDLFEYAAGTDPHSDRRNRFPRVYSWDQRVGWRVDRSRVREEHPDECSVP